MSLMVMLGALTERGNENREGQEPTPALRQAQGHPSREGIKNERRDHEAEGRTL